MNVPISERYRKQVILDEIGPEGQQRLLDAHVCVVGCGGLGSIAAMYLSGAGIGNMVLVDFDVPDITNLHRQVVYDTSAAGSKADQLALRISRLNTDVHVQVLNNAIHRDNIRDIIEEGYIVLDCTDDLNAKFLLSDYTAMHGIPLVYASIHKFTGYISFFNLAVGSDRGMSLRDFFPEKAQLKIPSCNDVGAYNVLAGIFGLMQANEVIKYILGMDGLLNGKLLIWSARDYSQQLIKAPINHALNHERIFNSEDYGSLSCADRTISISMAEWRKQNKDGIIISVLERGEEDLLDIADKDLPTSAFEEWKRSLSAEGDFLLYCRTGLRSDQLCLALGTIYPNARFYSLKGGFMAYAKGSTA